jgi:hypothetical protein
VAGLLAFPVLLGSARAAADEPAGSARTARAAAPVESRLSLKVALGGDYRSLYGFPVYGGDAQVAVGIDMGVVAVYGTAGLTLGRDQYGVAATICEVGGSAERRIDRFAFGMAFRPGLLFFDGIKYSNNAIGLGIAPSVGFDLIASEGHVLFLAARMNLDEYLVGGAVFAWGPTLSIGFREEDLQ